MEFINKFYVKIDKQDLLYYKSNSVFKFDVCLELLEYINKYEKENYECIDSFYLSVLSDYYRNLLPYFNFPIKKQSIVNAFLYATLVSDNKNLYRLIPFTFKDKFSLKEMGSICNYVLDHNKDFDELMYGEKEKIVFDHNTNQFVKGFIYGNSGIQKKLK